jgi:hypothetical protein
MSIQISDGPDRESPQVYAERILRQLRRRIERHLHQQARLNRAYRDWQSCWAEESDQLDQHLTRLEARLVTWLPTIDTKPPTAILSTNAFTAPPLDAPRRGEGKCMDQQTASCFVHGEQGPPAYPLFRTPTNRG